jgi:hypothetical protein
MMMRKWIPTSLAALAGMLPLLAAAPAGYSHTFASGKYSYASALNVWHDALTTTPPVGTVDMSLPLR